MQKKRTTQIVITCMLCVATAEDWTQRRVCPSTCFCTRLLHVHGHQASLQQQTVGMREQSVLLTSSSAAFPPISNCVALCNPTSNPNTLWPSADLGVHTHTSHV